jgi:hypothetical protein
MPDDEPIYCVTATGGVLVYPGACPVCLEPHRNMADRSPECWECRHRRADAEKTHALSAAERDWFERVRRGTCEASAAALRRDRDTQRVAAGATWLGEEP